jgi:hypothetical protein
MGAGGECDGGIPQYITATGGSSVTFARSSIATCIRRDGSGAILASGVPAVQVCPGCSSGPLGLIDEYLSVNLIPDSYDLTAASWTKTATVTGESYFGAFHSAGAPHDLEQLNDTSGAAQQGVSGARTTATLDRYACSAWLCADSANPSLTAQISMTGTGNSAGDRTCTFSSLPTCTTSGITAAKRVACVSTSPYAAGLTAVNCAVNVGSVVADQGKIGAGDVQLEVLGGGWGGFGVMTVTSYMPSSGGAATRARTSWSWVWPAGITNASTCVGFGSYKKQYDAETPVWNEGFGNDLAFILGRPLSGIESEVFDGTNVVVSSGTTGPDVNVYQWDRGAWTTNGNTSTVANQSPAGFGSGAYDGTITGVHGVIGADTTGGTNQTASWYTNIVMDTLAPLTVANNFCRGWSGGSDTTFVGDSIPSGTISGNSPSFPIRWGNDTGRVVYNVAVAGHTLSQAQTQWTNGRTYAAGTLGIHVGINDITVNGTMGAALWTNYQSFIESVANGGIRVVTSSLTPFGTAVDWTAPLETQRLAFNGLWHQYCASTGGFIKNPNVCCVDLDAAEWDPANHTNLLAANSFDGKHLSQTGANVAGDTYAAQCP